MPSLQDIMGMYQSFDPQAQFRQGQMESQKFDIQQNLLDEQTKDIQAEKQQAMQGVANGNPQPLQGMANQLLPGAKLQNDDGTLTTAGEMNQALTNATQLAKQGKIMMRQAALVEDPVQQAQVMAEGRRMIQNAQQDAQKAQKMHTDTKNDTIYALATAKNSQEWDNAIKAYQESGLPIPQGFSTDYSPENVKKVAALAPAALQSKINNDLIKREQDRRAEDRAERLARKETAAAQGNLGSSKTYDTLEEKVNDPNYGVAKGKIPAREQTVARRINTDSKEVVQGVDQVMALTNGGMTDTTGTTFANVKDNGLLTAPVKWFTNSISDKDSQMYDAMMYPLVKGISLYSNPDYRPTESDVKNAMQSYKAASGQPQEVQLEKMAELKKNFLAASESYLDSGILNPQQAKSLKQQIKQVQTAIPWDVKDVVTFTKQGGTQDFGDYLKSKGKQVSTPEETKSTSEKTAPKQISSQSEYDALKPGDKFIWNGKELTKGAK